MFEYLRLTRPLAVLDLETTGLDVAEDRIVEIAVARFAPDAAPTRWCAYVNPGVPIPEEAEEIHGIDDKQVAICKKFADMADEVLAILADCDLAGFNIKKYDLPLICHEFRRAGREFPLAGRSIIDVCEFYHTMERRTLEVAVQFYLNKSHEHSHSATGDVDATAQVLDAMLTRYEGVPRDVETLATMLRGINLDIAGVFKLINGEPHFALTKHIGKSLRIVAKQDAQYLRWMLTAGFLPDVKAIVWKILEAKCDGVVV